MVALRSWRFSPLLAGVLLLGAACRDAAPDAPEAAPLTPELRQVLEQVATIRGLRAPDALLAAPVAPGRTREALAATLTGEDREQFRHLTTLYRLLGQLGPDEHFEDVYLDFAADNLVGFYSPIEDRLFVVADGPTLDPGTLSRQQRSTVAHEFVHALQDANFDLPGLFKQTADDLDWSLALSAVLEGDAVVNEGLWTREHAFRPHETFSMLLSGGSASGVSASIEREFRFPYEAGAEWVSTAGPNAGRAAVNEVLSGRRITTAEILHPGLRAAGWTPASVALPDVSRALGGGWKHEAGGAFGEFHLRNYLQLHAPALAAVGAADGWSGDRYDVYVRDGAAVAVLRVRFRDAQESSEFVTAHDRWLTEAGAELRQSEKRTFATLADGRTIARSSTPGEVTLVIGSNREFAEKAAAILGGG